MLFRSQGIQGPQGEKGPQGDPTTVNGKTGASIVLTGDDIAISADDDATVKERVNNVRSAASTAQSTADTAVTKANAAQSTANNAMPKSGGTFTGAIVAPYLNLSGYYVRNIWCGDANEHMVNTTYIWTKRK